MVVRTRRDRAPRRDHLLRRRQAPHWPRSDCQSARQRNSTRLTQWCGGGACKEVGGLGGVQRLYTPTFIRSSVAGAVAGSRRDNYRLLMVGARGIPPRLAMNLDVTDGGRPNRAVSLPLGLSQSALQRGYVLLYLGPRQSFRQCRLVFSGSRSSEEKNKPTPAERKN
jgi:hypothetical protein